MKDLLLMTNADAANTLSIVAWVILFFILLNVVLLAYTMIRNKRNAAKGASAQPESPKTEPAEKKEKPVSVKKEKPQKKQQTAPMPVSEALADAKAEPEAETEAEAEDTFNMALTDVSNPERRFVAEGKKEYLVGRKPQMDLCIPDDGYVSGTHCKFEMKETVLYITDMGSSNGTKVNGTKIEAPTPLADNDTVRIGKVEYRVNY